MDTNNKFGSLNLAELDELIAAIPADDKEMIAYYLNKRKNLVADISKEINRILNEGAK
jgi:hypothetical protein